MARVTPVLKPRSGPAAPAASYDEDVILWSREQAWLLRARRLAELDIERLASAIESMGKSEQRELARRMAALTVHLLAWRGRSEMRTDGGRAMIADARKRIALALKETPSLIAAMGDPDWREGVWLDARAHARSQIGLNDDALPDACPWTIEEAIDADFWPAAPRLTPFAVGLKSRRSD